jgi:hypothetical protein
VHVTTIPPHQVLQASNLHNAAAIAATHAIYMLLPSLHEPRTQAYLQPNDRAALPFPHTQLCLL